MLLLCYKENTFDTFRVKKKEKENVNFTHYAEVPQLLLTLSIKLLGGKCSCLCVMHRVTVLPRLICPLQNATCRVIEAT